MKANVNICGMRDGQGPVHETLLEGNIALGKFLVEADACTHPVTRQGKLMSLSQFLPNRTVQRVSSVVQSEREQARSVVREMRLRHRVDNESGARRDREADPGRDDAQAVLFKPELPVSVGYSWSADQSCAQEVLVLFAGCLLRC